MNARYIAPLLLACGIALGACGGESPATADGGGQGPPPGGGTLWVDAGTRYQTIVGWEAVAQAGQQDNPLFALYADTLFDLAVNDLGLSRLRLSIRSGAESVRDDWADWRAGLIDDATWRCRRYTPVNDNADPASADQTRFHFAEMDLWMDKVVVPIRQRLQARGEKLWLNVNYVGFTKNMCAGGQLVHDAPPEYAEFVLETVKHLKNKYGIVPDSWELILEPDNTNYWRGPEIARALVAASDRLRASGFGSVQFVGPSTTNMSNAVTYIDGMATVPGAMSRLSELSYHRYGGVSGSALQQIADRAKRYGLRAAMLEHIASGYDDLHADLETGSASAWQQFTIAYGRDDTGGQLYVVDDANPAHPVIRPGSRTTYLRQYFRWVRPGATRVRVTSAASELDPLGFVNADGTYVVVVKAERAASFSVGGLAAGRYGVAFTTAGAMGVEQPETTLTAGAVLNTSIPAAGVLTIYGK